MCQGDYTTNLRLWGFVWGSYRTTITKTIKITNEKKSRESTKDYCKIHNKNVYLYEKLRVDSSWET